MNPAPVLVPDRKVTVLSEGGPRRDRHRRRRRSVRVDREGKTKVVLWLPVTPVFWILSPFAVLLAPLLCLAPPFQGVNPYLLAARLGAVLVSVSGTVIHVDAPDAHVHLRLF